MDWWVNYAWDRLAGDATWVRVFYGLWSDLLGMVITLPILGIDPGWKLILTITPIYLHPLLDFPPT